MIAGGGCVAKEYYLMPEKTQEEFFDRDGKRWFRCVLKKVYVPDIGYPDILVHSGGS